MDLKSKWKEMESRRIAQYSASEKNRPFLVSLIALIGMSISILVILVGIFFILSMISYYGEVNTFIGGGMVIASGIMIFALGYGLWNLNHAAWFVTVILHGLLIIAFLLNFQVMLLALQSGSWSRLLERLLPLIVIIMLLFYFIRVRDKFPQR
jgi:hypothetical protein